MKSVELKKQKSVQGKTIDLLLSVVTMNTRIISREIEEKDAFSAFQKIDIDSLNLLEDFQKNIEEFLARQ